MGQSNEEFYKTPQLPRYAKRTAYGKPSVTSVLTSPRKRYAPGLRGWTAVLVWPAEKEESRDPMTAAATLAMCAHSDDAITRRPGWSRRPTRPLRSLRLRAHIHREHDLLDQCLLQRRGSATMPDILVLIAMGRRQGAKECERSPRYCGPEWASRSRVPCSLAFSAPS